jgi:hypothetical protein
MRSAQAAIFLALLTSLGCTPSEQPGTPSPATAVGAGKAATDDLTVGQPVRHANLTIFPVVSATARNDNPFITLDQGLKAGSVEILEMTSASRGRSPSGNERPTDGDDPFGASPDEETTDPAEEAADASTPQPEVPQSLNDEFADPFGAVQIDADEAGRHDSPNDDPGIAEALALEPQEAASEGGAAEVNRVLIVNRSDRPLYLMPGEIIIGGQQDRVIGRELVIQPGNEPQPIPVFCVEHGRWNDRDEQQTVGFLQAAESANPQSADGADPDPDARLRAAAAAANEGKFVASVGNLSKPARLSLQTSQNQGEVWDAVARENEKGKASSETDAFTANYAAEEAVERLRPYLASLEAPVADTDRIVGVIVAVNGKVDSLDIFQSTPLFRQLWPKLLKSYALDAANASKLAEDDVKQSVCSKDDAQSFLVKAMRAQVKKSELTSQVAVTTRAAEGVITFSSELTEESSEASPSEGSMGGFGGAMHTSAFAQ